MSQNPFQSYTPQTANAYAMDTAAGLRAYMLKVYNYMALGLAFTGAISFLILQNIESFAFLFNKTVFMVLIFATMGYTFFIPKMIYGRSSAVAQFAYWSYAALNALLLTPLLAYAAQSGQTDEIARAFFVTAGAFAGLSFVGYTTKKDLSKMGTFLIMAVWGLIILSIINLFTKSPMMTNIICMASVLVFAGLTVYDTQMIKDSYYEQNAEQRQRTAIYGALMLYIDFIAMFRSILVLLLNRR